MFKWYILWMVFGALTWVLEILAFGIVSCSRYDEQTYLEIGHTWIDYHFESMTPDFLKKSKLLVNLWQTVCTIVCWPLDRLILYINWKTICRQYEA